MIKATPAFGTEPWEKDNWRNRILLRIGKKSWHLSREEAGRVSRQLLKALEDSKPEVFTGTFIKDGMNCFLDRGDGEQIAVVHRDWTWLAAEGKTVEVTGRLKADKGIYVIKWSEPEG